MDKNREDRQTRITHDELSIIFQDAQAAKEKLVEDSSGETSWSKAPLFLLWSFQGGGHGENLHGANLEPS